MIKINQIQGLENYLEILKDFDAMLVDNRDTNKTLSQQIDELLNIYNEIKKNNTQIIENQSKQINNLLKTL